MNMIIYGKVNFSFSCIRWNKVLPDDKYQSDIEILRKEPEITVEFKDRNHELYCL